MMSNHCASADWEIIGQPLLSLEKTQPSEALELCVVIFYSLLDSF